MSEKKFYPPEAANFQVKSSQEVAAQSPAVENKSAVVSAAKPELPANYALSFKKLTREFAFDPSPEAQTFLRLANQIDDLENGRLPPEKEAQLQSELTQALSHAEQAFATNNNMFATMLKAFDGSPQEFKRAYLKSRQGKEASPKFSTYLQETYQRTKLRRLRNVYQGLLAKMQHYQQQHPGELGVGESGVATNINAAENVLQHHPAASGAVENSSSAAPANAHESLAATTGAKVAGQEAAAPAAVVNAASSETASLANASEVANLSETAPVLAGANSEENTATNHVREQTSSQETVSQNAQEATSPEQENFASVLSELKAQLEQITTPQEIDFAATNNFFNQYDELSDSIFVADKLQDSFLNKYPAQALSFAREYAKLKKKYDSLTRIVDFDFDKKVVVVPQVNIDPSVKNLALKLDAFYKETGDTIRKTYALDQVRTAVAAVEQFMASKKDSLHTAISEYVAALCARARHESVEGDSGNKAVEAMRRAKTFPDAMEWLFYNASSKGDPSQIAEALPIFQERISSFYQEKINHASTEAEKQAIEKAKKQGLDFMKVMWDNALNGNYANDNVSLGSGRLRLAKDAKNTERALIENFVKAADKGAAERANSQLNMNEMFHTLAIAGEGENQVAINEYFDWITQGNREGVAKENTPASVGPLQEVISILYTQHLSNRDSKYSFEKLFLNLQDGVSQNNGALMDSLVDIVLGKNAAELEQKMTNETDPKIKKAYERIYQQLQHHSPEMFAIFKMGIQYKVARDNLTELAAFQNAALNGASLPNVGGNELKKGSFGIMASIPVQLLRFRSGEVKDAPKTLPLVSTAFNIDKVLDTTAATMGKGSKDENIKSELQQYILKYKHVNEVVVRPQLKDLLPDITSNLAYWWQGGIPPEVYALNSGKSLSAWKNAEEAMIKLQKIAAMSETRYNDGFLNNDNYQVSQRELNTIVSIIQGYTGTAAEYRGRDEDAKKFWQERNEKLTKNDGSLDYVDINVLSLYLSALTYEVLGNPSDVRTFGEDGNQANYDNHIEKKRKSVVTGAGKDNALKKDLYLPIVKYFFGNDEGQHGEIRRREIEEVESGFFGLFKKKIVDMRNDFMIHSRDEKNYDSDLEERIKDYILEWLPSKPDGYNYDDESRDLDVVPSEYSMFATNVGITPRDRELRLMNHNPAVVEKITEKHNL